MLHILKLCLIVVGPTLYQFSKCKKCFCYIHFFYKTKLILIPQAKKSTTELILVQMTYQKYRPPPILVRRCALWQMVLNVRLRNHENSENGEKLSLDLIFINNCWQIISCFCKQNSIQRIYSTPTEFIQTGQKFTRSFSVHFLVQQTEQRTNWLWSVSMLCPSVIPFYRVFHLDMLYILWSPR